MSPNSEAKMPPQDFDETLVRFGLESLKPEWDIQVTQSGDIATTRDGDLQLGNARANGMFRFIERWGQSESAIAELFGPMTRAAKRLESLSSERANGTGPSLSKDPQQYHKATDAIVEAQLVSSTLAGAIAVIQNNLLIRLKLDLSASEHEWREAPPAFRGYSLGQIFSAAAANFRHYDEWASTRPPTSQQRPSMEILCSVLNLPMLTAHGHPSIRTNVCDKVLMLLSRGSVDTLHQLTVEYAKSLAKHP
jgi:hypothetical protein